MKEFIEKPEFKAILAKAEVLKKSGKCLERVQKDKAEAEQRAVATMVHAKPGLFLINHKD